MRLRWSICGITVEVTSDAGRISRKILDWRESVAFQIFRLGAWVDVRATNSDDTDHDLVQMYRLLRAATDDQVPDRVLAIYECVHEMEWQTTRNVLTLLLLEVGGMRRPLTDSHDVQVLADDAMFLLLADRMRSDD